MKLFIGLMSGTSMDGVDAAIVDLDNNKLIHGITRPYSDTTWKMLQSVLQNDKTDYVSLNQLNTLIGRDFAASVMEVLQQSGISGAEIQAIGSHGQTICHDATANIPYTIQLGCAHTIARLTGITVVADFRTGDLVAGGQGAPFAPIYHQELFKGLRKPLAAVNVGGIANVTLLTDEPGLLGFDVGPGNCLLDAWITKHLKKPFDANGEWGAGGKVIQPLLNQLLIDPFFDRNSPKSIGKEYFNLDWLIAKLQDGYAPQDVQATLVMLTATLIAEAIKQSSYDIKECFVCGGGVYNTELFEALNDKLANVSVKSTSELGVDPDFLEAMMFAWLAEKAINKIPVDLSTLTGASGPSALGAIYYPGKIKQDQTIF